MKTFFNILALLFLAIINNEVVASGHAPVSNAAASYHAYEYKPGTLVMKVRPEFRSACSENSIAIPRFQKALFTISSNGVTKKFPRHEEPKEKVNKYGQKLVDLSLIYKVEFSPVIKMDEAINILKSTDIFEYVEPVSICHMDFTPNDPYIGLQYQLGKINAYNAWNIWTGDTNTVIGIVDSGTDWDHPDLQGNIKYNYADTIDGIDNDNDGFIDNYRGWDISENDNNPTVVGSTHGSHVSGCADAITNNGIGVAGPAYHCKFLPVKVALDASQTTIDNGYDGIVYAADHGVSVINCSWGATGLPSQTEQDVINYATYNKDVLVVAAAGNTSQDQTHYPSSYENVISVAATDKNDHLASFSTYNATVDVSAPGNNILATIYNNAYDSLSGTSMASPIAAGCAAMIRSRFPSLSALQAGEQLRVTSDNIYNINAAYLNKMGSGRVNLFKAVSDSISSGVVLKKESVSDGNDNLFVQGDTLSIVGLFQNLLRPTTNLTCSLSTYSTDVTILQANYNAGVLGTLDTISNFSNPYRVYINPTAPLNTDVQFIVTLTDGAWHDNYIFSLTLNVDYINININNVSTSITSKSTIGYNQPGKLQGLGFTYMGNASILYDMGLMVGAQSTQVSDDVRGAPATAGNDADFVSVQNVTSLEPGVISDFDVNGVFRDNGTSSTHPLNVIISHHSYAWVTAPDNNYVMVQYFIKNNGTTILDTLAAGLCADWDVNTYANNKCSTDVSRRMGYVWCTDSAGLYGGIKLLSHHGQFNHYALDNNANSGILLTDGFDNTEKYTAMTTSRLDAGTATTAGNDVLSVVATNGLSVAPGDSVEITFAIMAGPDLASLQADADAAQIKYDNIFNGIIPVGNADKNELFQSYPNPADKELRLELSLVKDGFSEISIYNLVGEKVKGVLSEKLNAGRYSIVVDVSDLPAGQYLYRLSSGNYTRTLPMTIMHN